MAVSVDQSRTWGSPGGGREHVAPPATSPDGVPVTAALPSRAQHARQFALHPTPVAVAQGRQAVRETLRSWEMAAVADTAVLLASELLTNAVKATSATATAARSPERIWLTVQHTGPGVLVEVWDPSSAPAIPLDPGLTDECGRGLLLVVTLSSTWGQRAVGAGKIVWCEITLPSADQRGREP